jgi:hypothetical protein
MPRLADVGPDDLDDRQRELWNELVEGARGRAFGKEPRVLAGPFNPWLYSPGAGLCAARLGDQLRFIRRFLPGCVSSR